MHLAAMHGQATSSTSSKGGAPRPPQPRPPHANGGGAPLQHGVGALDGPGNLSNMNMQGPQHPPQHEHPPLNLMPPGATGKGAVAPPNNVALQQGLKGAPAATSIATTDQSPINHPHQGGSGTTGPPNQIMGPPTTSGGAQNQKNDNSIPGAGGIVQTREPQHAPHLNDSATAPAQQHQQHQAAMMKGPQKTGIVVSLEEVSFFLEDMDRTVWWLLKIAKVKLAEKMLHSSTMGGEMMGVEPTTTLCSRTFGTDPEGLLVRGDEQLPPDHIIRQEPWYATMESIEKNVLAHIETHEHQLRTTQEQRELLDVLKLLRFNSGGRISIFDIPSVEMNHKTLWSFLHADFLQILPQFATFADLVEGGSTREKYFMQSISIVPYVCHTSSKEGDRIKLYSVWHPDKKRRHWSFVTGDIQRSHGTVEMAAKILWHEAVGVFYQWTWEKTFKKGASCPSRSTTASSESRGKDHHHGPSTGVTEKDFFLYVHHEKEGSKYQVRPYLFLNASEDFYDRTTIVSEAIPDIGSQGLNCVRYDDLFDKRKMVHTQGHYYKSFDDSCWLDLDWETGRLSSRKQGERGNINRNLEILFKQQPKKLWSDLFGQLLGKSEADCANVLGKDLPTQPPFSAHMIGIDKAASTEDIIEFFKDGAPHCQVLEVIQMAEPRHSARVNFVDQPSLRAGLRKHNEYLKRRKVKLELWEDGTYCVPAKGGAAATTTETEGGDGDAPKPANKRDGPSEYTGPLPEEGPFKCICRNLDRNVTDNDLGYFFWDRDCEPKYLAMEVAGKHSGVVEFDSREHLKSALRWNGVLFKGREISILLWTPEDEKAHEERERSRSERADNSTFVSGGSSFDNKDRDGGGGKTKRGGDDRGHKGDRDFHPRDRQNKDKGKGGGKRREVSDSVWERGIKPQEQKGGKEGNGHHHNSDKDHGGRGGKGDRLHNNKGNSRDQHHDASKADKDDNWRRGG
ncbi:unnamed protein product [Amoebophrya sp. A25]|nr:unnamed protein product [Amoebophrya sp. A25]|eukprot:GSA25T00026482001.1